MKPAPLATLLFLTGCASPPPAASPVPTTTATDRPLPIREEALTTRDAIDGEPAMLGTALAAAPLPVAEIAPPTPSEMPGIPPVRAHLGLTIHEPPRARADTALGLVTSDVEGALQVNGQRVWVGPSVPAHVPPGIDALELFQLHPFEGGHFALYRDMFAAGGMPGCAANSMADNCTYRGRLYRPDGALALDIDFNALMHRRDHLRIGDLVIEGDTLFYSQACQSYSKEADGACSNVVALDLSAQPPRERWRSRFLVSNAPIRSVGDYLVTGYGFTAEPDYLAVLDKKNGAVVLQVGLPTAPEGIALRDGVLEVHVYGRLEPLRFSVTGFASSVRPDGTTAPSKPRLLRVRAKG